MKGLLQNFMLLNLIMGIAMTGNSQETKYVKDELIAQFVTDAPLFIKNGEVQLKSKVDRLLLKDSLGLEKIKPLFQLKDNLQKTTNFQPPGKPFLLAFEGDINVQSTIERLEKTDLFVFVEPNYIGKAGGNPQICKKHPNDSLFDRQWGLHNDGTFDQKSVPDADIDMNHAWKISTGDSSIVVAILDSGINPDHPEFSGRIWQNIHEIPFNQKDDDNNNFSDDTVGWNFVQSNNDIRDNTGHGTHVAGVLGANGNNQIGYAGVDWQCRLMPLKVLNGNNRGKASWWIAAINYAVRNGADVINMSLGSSDESLGLEITIDNARDSGVLVVASMMNENTNTPYYPAAYESTIAVGATDTDNERAEPFYGTTSKGSNYGSHIDLVAPGNKIYGLSHQSNANYNVIFSGTSQATPLVTGTISLIESVTPDLGVDSIRSLVTKGAIDKVGRQSKDTAGWDPFYGHGVLNAYNSLLLANKEKFVTCSSFTVPSGDESYDSNELFKDTIHRSGCDSVYYGQLKVGDTSHTLVKKQACHQYTLPSDDKTYQSGGIYRDTLKSSLGCDSFLRIDLQIDNPKAKVAQNGSLLKILNDSGNYQWVNCDDNYTPIHNADEQTFEPQSNGNYALVLSKNGCSDTSKCYQVNPSTSKQRNVDLNPVKIVPNPTSGVVKVEFEKVQRNFTVEICNSLGRVLSRKSFNEKQKFKINIQQPAGLYYVKINFLKNKKEVYKVVKH